MNFAERATDYARRVASGEIPAGLFVRLACQRHLDDLEASEDDAYPYYFDHDAANRVCQFIEYMPHVKGKWARERKTIELEDWQCFLVGVPFGWLRRSDGLRRFRRAYSEVCRKNAKSTISAALGLYLFTADGEYGAEVYSGATTEKQAWEVFGPARLMADKTDDLKAEFGISVGAKNIAIRGNNSKFEPIIGNPGDGASPSGAIIDEYHEHKTDAQLETMSTGMGAREQPMLWVITTAGSDTSGPCYALRDELLKVLQGNIDDPELFGIVYTIDEGVDWTSEEALIMANPNVGVSVSLEYLKSQQRKAINNPRKQASFKTKHLNVWVGAASPYFNLELWNRLADTSLEMEQFAGETSAVGLDLASKIDLACRVTLFEREIEGKRHVFAFLHAYIPEEVASAPGKEHYAGWATEGHLIATDGNITDYDEIEENLLEDAERFPIGRGVGFDPWNATQLATHLINEGLECVEVPQTAKNLSEPMKEIQALIEDGRIHHNGNPVFAWGIGNVTAQVDRNDNVFPRKERPENKIDPAVALIIAMRQLMHHEEAPPSVYKTRGLQSV
ncbi:MAG: terminase TerL endonuclease subunit [Gemmatimonadota bacterium]